MSRYSFTHAPAPVLDREMKALVRQDSLTTATLIARIAEYDARRLYAPAGYPSMLAYVTGELGLEEHSAYKRIGAARVAREHPAVFEMLADGRLHLTAVLMLGPHLTAANAGGLLAAASHRTRAAIEMLLAERFPKPDLPAGIAPLAGQLAPERVKFSTTEQAPAIPAPLEVPRPRVAPLSPHAFGLQCTLSEAAFEKLRYAQALLGHDLPTAALPGVLERALDALIVHLERQRFAATSRPCRRRGPASDDPRHVPAAVKRAVWERDGGQCTFVSAAGHRCEARTNLEWDHIDPVARGGRATEANLRVRCRAHNQLAADEAFGAGFMDGKRHATRPTPAPSAMPRADEAAERALAEQAARDEAARSEAALREAEAARAQAAEAAIAAAEEMRRRAAAAAEVVPYLRSLDIRAEEARAAASACESIPDAPLEERIRRALQCYGRTRRGHRVEAPRPAA